MDPRELQVGEIVQLSPETVRNPMFSACLLIVTEPKQWGCQGFVQSLGEDGEPGGRAYYRANWDEIEATSGLAAWLPAPEEL